jgi:hypothetical protein
MSTDAEATFEESVRLAAECYVAKYGLEGAIDELQARRRDPDIDTDRVNEALAYLKREATGGTDL